MKWIMLIVLLLTSSCLRSANCEGSYRLEGLTPWQEQRVRNGAALFEPMAGKPVIRIEENGKCKVTVSGVSNRVEEKNATGGYDGVTGNIGIDGTKLEALMTQPGAAGLEEKNWEFLFAHEFAHSLGMDHLPEGEVGIMSAGISAWLYDGFTEADHAECVRSLVCDQ